MSRLWSRFAVRSLAVALLCTGVAGGYYLGNDRETQQEGIDAQLAARTEALEMRMLHEEHAAQQIASAPKRAAEYEAGVQADQVARAADERAQRAESAAADRAQREQERKEQEEKAEKPYDGPIPASCNEFSGARKIGCAVMLSSGFGIDQFPCLDKLYTRESGWNYKAKNPSGAYGIPQARPGNKMASAGDDWETSPATQVKWGLGYIKDRYDTPCGAWQQSEDAGWY